MSALLAIDIVGDDVPTQLAIAAVDPKAKAIVAEKAWSFEGASQGLADIFAEVDDFSRQWGGKPGIVSEGGVFHQTLLPRAAKRGATAKQRISAGRHWQRYHDITREVERTCGDKCSGTMALMLTAGVEPQAVARGPQTANALAQVVIALLEKGNEFKRPLAAGPRGAPAGDDGDDEDGKKTKAQKRKRAEEEAEAAAAAAAEAEAEEAAAVPVVPSLPLLRNTLFLSGAARDGLLPDVTTAADAILSGFGAAAPAGTPSQPPAKRAKAGKKSPKQAPAAAPASALKFPSAAVAVESGYTGGAEWASVVYAQAVNRYFAEDESVPARAPSAYTTALLVLPTLKACLEAAAMLADLGVDLVLHPGAIPDPPSKKKAAAAAAERNFALPAITPKVTITTHDAWEVALDAVRGAGAGEGKAVATGSSGVAVFILEDDTDTATTDAVAAYCGNAPGAAELTAGVFTLRIPGERGSMEAVKTSGTEVALPKAAEGEDYPQTQLDYDASDAHVASLDPRVLYFAYQNSLPHLAGVLHEMHSAKIPIVPTSSLLCYYLLATTAAPVAPPADNEICPQLRAVHMLLARLFVEVERLAGDPKPTRTGLINDFARAVLAMPLLPVKSDVQCKEQIYAERPNLSDHHAKQVVNGDEVAFTGILSTIAPHITDEQIDGLGELWNVRVLVQSPNLEAHAVKHGKKPARLLACMEGALVKRLSGVHLGVALDVVAEGMQWHYFAKEFGTLQRVLARCKKSFMGDRRQGVVYVSTVADATRAVGVNVLPLCGRKNEEVKKMTKAAIEEILTILPRGTRRCMLSSLGVSLHSWQRFNVRHENLLGPSMVHFLMSHPEHFIVSGKVVQRADPKSSPEYDTRLLKHGGREDKTDPDEAKGNQKARKRGSRQDRIHNVIADKWRRKQARNNSLKSAAAQKIPGFGKKKGKYKGKGTTPHWMK